MESLSFDKYEAVICDLDGTLADSMPAHFHAWTDTLERLDGRPTRFTEALFYSKGGVTAREIIAWLNRDYGYNLPIEQTVHEKEERFVELLSEVRPIEPVIKIVKELASTHKLAVASGGLTHIVRKTIALLGLSDYFKVIVSANEVTKGKPSPEIFLKAAHLLGVEPAKCVVFEDAEPGFQAARAAGMDFVDVKPYYCEGRDWYTVSKK